MNQQIKGLLYFYMTHVRHSLIIFWSILFAILFVSLTFDYFLKDVDDSFFTFSLTGPMYVYCGIYGFILVKDWIPFTIKLGATRKNIFASLGVFFVAVSVLLASMATVIQSVVNALSLKIGIHDFMFMHLAYFFTDTWYTRILIDSSVMLLFFSLLFIFGLFFYKYGLLGGGIFGGLIFLTLIVGVAQGWLIDFAMDVFSDVNLMLFWQVALIAVILFGLSWILVRNITIVKKT